MILLSDVIAENESSQNPLSMRFEITYNPSLNGIKNAQEYATAGYMDINTARMICQTSWGKFQIMGDNIYNLLNINITLLDYLSDKNNIQLNAFNMFIRHIGFTNCEYSMMSERDKEKFAQAYNGSLQYIEGMNEAYANLVGQGE